MGDTTPWSDADTEQLKVLWIEGLSASQIGHALSKTRNSVLGKAHRLNLSSRAPTGNRMERAPTPRVYVPGVRLPEPEPILEPPLQLEDGAFVTVITITDRMCRWPIGDPLDADFHFCGRGPHKDRPYCEAHAKKAYVSGKPYVRKEYNPKIR